MQRGCALKHSRVRESRFGGRKRVGAQAWQLRFVRQVKSVTFSLIWPRLVVTIYVDK